MQADLISITVFIEPLAQTTYQNHWKFKALALVWRSHDAHHIIVFAQKLDLFHWNLALFDCFNIVDKPEQSLHLAALKLNGFVNQALRLACL